MSLLSPPLRWTSGLTLGRPALLRFSSTQHSDGRMASDDVEGVLTEAPFAALGLRSQIVDALQKAFPNVVSPTKIQRSFIKAIGEGKDVMLKDATGTGKTFGITLALLNMPRVSKPDRMRVNNGEKPPINSLIIVPHKDLAYQVLHWTQRIVSALDAPSPLLSYSSVAEVLVRGTGVSPAEHASRLRDDPPHILIGTPQAIWEIMQEDQDALQPQHLSTLVVDEVDYLIPSTPRGSNVYKQRRMEKQMAMHPSVTASIIDEILRTRPQKEARGERGERWQDLTVKQRQQTRPPLQLVFSSATLRTHMHMNLRSREGWVTKGHAFARITGKPKKPASTSPIVTPTTTVLGGSGITHSVIVVDRDGTVANIEGAVTRAEALPVEEESMVEDQADAYEDAMTSLDYVNDLELDAPVSVGGVRKALKTSPAILETVASCFALDVPRVAMLVMPASSPVHAVVSELRELGVNAHGLDLLAQDRGRGHLLQGPSDVAVPNPTLLVASEATVRGVDLPDLSHVFLLGVPAGRKADGYLHIAGRVGRFGRGGQVVTVLDKLAEDDTPSKIPRKMQVLLKELKIVPTKFEHFD